MEATTVDDKAPPGPSRYAWWAEQSHASSEASQSRHNVSRRVLTDHASPVVIATSAGGTATVQEPHRLQTLGLLMNSSALGYSQAEKMIGPTFTLPCRQLPVISVVTRDAAGMPGPSR